MGCFWKSRGILGPRGGAEGEQAVQRDRVESGFATHCCVALGRVLSNAEPQFPESITRIKGTPPRGTCRGLIEVPPPSWAHTAEMPAPPHGPPNWCLQVPAAAKHWNLGQGQRETWDLSSPGWPGQSFGQMSQRLPEDPPTESRLSYVIGWESLIDTGQGRGGGGGGKRGGKRQ